MCSLNNTNVDWKNTATVLNCVSARWQDEEDRPPISIFWGFESIQKIA